MEFHGSISSTPPRNLYPCLATINVLPAGSEPRSRRMSAGSFGSDDDNALKRVISGGRRKSSFGEVAGDGRRRSFVGGASGASGATGEDGSGKWYWRVQAGANDSQIVLLPLSQPANPLLTSPPQPLSQAMPKHSENAQHSRAPGQGAEQDGDHERIGSKIKNLFRRGSAMPQHSTDQARPAESAAPADQGELAQHTNGSGNDTTSQATATTATAVEDRIIDQTPRGEMLPSAEANRTGANNLDANAETGWPGYIHGDKLGSITIDLRSIDKSKVVLGGGKKGEGSWVVVPIFSNFGNMASQMIEPIGRTHHDIPKSGTVRFDFDKDWLGAKAEAELLHHHILTAIQGAANQPAPERHVPVSTNFQIGQGQHSSGTASTAAPVVPPISRDVAPDERVVG